MQIPSTPGLFAPSVSKPAQPSGFFATPDAPETSKAKAEFAAYMQRTPAEQLRKEILDSLGISEEDLKAADPKLREQLERKIEERMKQKVEQGAREKGALVDVKA